MYNAIRMLFVALLLVGCQHNTVNKDMPMQYELVSPNQQSRLVVTLTEKGQPQYQLFYKNSEVIKPSVLGFELQQNIDLTQGFDVIEHQTHDVDETWQQPWGEQKNIRNHYRELRLALKQNSAQGYELNLTFRLFDDGLGFQYAFPEQANLSDIHIVREITAFNTDNQLDAWWTPAQAGNQYEYLYQHSKVNEIKLVHTPLTMIADNYALSIHEAALSHYSTMNLAYDNGLHAELVPWSPQDSVKVKAKTPFVTPWRSIALGDDENGLITNYITLNLNEPNKLGDVSWIKPGKFVGIWWELHLELGSWASGEKHGATTANAKKYIDFAAQSGLDSVLVEGWNKGWDGEWWKHNGKDFSFTEAYPDYDIAEVNRYAHEKGVFMVGHHETAADVNHYESQMSDAYDLLNKYGMKAVKSGYVETGELLTSGEYHQGQYFVEHADRAIKMAAKHHVMLAAHETIKDTGKRRTYPNMMTREVARGQEYDAWSTDGGNPPNHTTILPYTRMLSGPMDFTPGVFDVMLPTRPNNRVNTTLVKQLALYVVLYSPLQMVSDLPENYAKHPDAFEFIKDVPTDWNTTKVLSGKMSEYIAIARQQRDSENWYVGAITNENARELELNFDFLSADKVYEAVIYQDAEGTGYQNQPTEYQIHKQQISAGDTLRFTLGSSGGLAISLKPVIHP